MDGMRILLLGWGSRGDVEPFIALGLGLQREGHDVAIAAGRDYAAWIESFGLACEPFSIDMQEGMQSPEGRQWLGASSGNPREELRAMTRVVQIFAPILAADLLRMVRPDDLVVSSTLTFDPMLAIARERGCRHVTALFAGGLPTRTGDASLFPVRAGRDSFLNVAGGYAAVAVMHRVTRRPGDLVRDALGQPRDTFFSYARQASQVPVLIAASPLVVPLDAGPRVRVTGWWSLPEPAPDVLTAQVPGEVRAFVESGERPVYVGFGSMTSPDPGATRALLVEAARRFGGRVVLHRGHDDHTPPQLRDELPDDVRDRVLVVGSVPHAWLLPRCAAVVTHGGAGSTGAGLRAGVPSMAVPHIGDQPFWGRRLHELGVGPAPIRRCDLTPGALADALRTMTRNARMRARAAELGARISAEDGVGTAVELLQNHLARSTPAR